MPRQANAVDFWRGFALVTIFINHVPGTFYERFTHRNLSISDSADLFVFLAGWSLRYVVGRPEKRAPARYLVLRLCGRAFQIYIAHILLIAIAIAMLASAALILANPLLLEWHNAAAVFQDPVETHIGLVLLTHQFGYFDILPLYVVLMALAPGIALIDRYAPRLLLPLSLAVYFATLVSRTFIPTWPVDGRWFFNPLTWQLIFVLGFVIARHDGLGGWTRRNIRVLRFAAVPIVILGALVVQFNLWPDPTKVPEPRLLFIGDKSFMTPMRLIQFLALAALFSAAFPFINWAIAPAVRFLSMLGRNSLNVFCVASVLSLGGQITRFVYKGYVSVDTVVVIVGIALMGATAWLSEWRDRETRRG